MADHIIYVQPEHMMSFGPHLRRFMPEWIWPEKPDGTIERPFHTLQAAMNHIAKIADTGHRIDVHVGSGVIETNQILEMPERGSIVLDNASYVTFNNLLLKRRGSVRPHTKHNPAISVRNSSYCCITGCHNETFGDFIDAA